MRSRLILGQILCIAGILVLSPFVPLMPQVTGLPKHRIVEMLVFWLGFGLLVCGCGQSLGATPRPLNPDGRRTLAAMGTAVAVLVCVVALTNLFFSSLQGIGFRPPGAHSDTLYPREFGYILFVPFLASLGCQLPLLTIGKSPFLTPSTTRWRVARLILLPFLAILFLFFCGSCLLFLLNRWYAVASVGVTWVAGFVSLALAVDQIVWARSGQ